MNRIMTIACATIAIALAFLTSGCVTPVVCSAEFTKPARSIPSEDLAKINTLRIQVVSNYSSNIANYGGEQDASLVTGIIQENMISSLYREGYYRVIDVIWGNMDGVNHAYKNAHVEGSAHGYPSFITDSFPRAALLKITFEANVTATEKTKSEAYKLTRIPYDMKTDDKGVPSSRPNYDQATFREEIAPHDLLQIQGKGTLIFELTDADGDLILQQTYPLDYEREDDCSCPTNASLIEEMTKIAIKEFVAEISPVKVKNRVPVNMRGCKEAILLLGAGAYSEAIECLERLPDDKITIADYENLGIAFEVIGNLIDAKTYYEKANCTAGLERIAEMRTSRKDLKKTDKTNDDTSFRADKQ